jgi:dTDP-4-dehydrorhamnose reductase
MEKVVVLGSQGMLGHEIARTLRNEGFEVRGTVRGSQTSGGSLHFNFDGTYKSVNEFFTLLQDASVVVNCIGLIPQKQTSTNQYRDYISYNTLLPSFLDRSADKFGFKVIQIATDCVFSGMDGMYSEESPHDATDVYGITKSMGEITSSNFLNLRCSIIGNEIEKSVSLHDWLLQHDVGATVNGYVDHLWNGITTLSFAKIVSGVLRSGNDFSGTRHIVPRNNLSKFELLRAIAQSAGRSDLVIKEYDSGAPIDRRLKTKYPEYNEQLWTGAGYASIPSLEELIEEFEKRD